jgi:hypothetical protein
MLTALNEHVLQQLENTKILDRLHRENVFPAKSRFGDALKEAITAAESWIASRAWQSSSELLPHAQPEWH